MANRYYLAIRPQTDDFHAVHKNGCPFLPVPEKRIFLGSFNNGNDAALTGLKYYRQVKVCLYCMKDSYEAIEPAFTETDFTKYLPSEDQISVYEKEGPLYFLN